MSTDTPFRVLPLASDNIIDALLLADPINAPVSTVTLGMIPSPPQPPGVTITFTATATGGGVHREYKWFVYDGARWITAAAWSTDHTFQWIPPLPSPRWRVAVWVRSDGSDADDFEACADIGFTISDR